MHEKLFALGQYLFGCFCDVSYGPFNPISPCGHRYANLPYWAYHWLFKIWRGLRLPLRT